MHNNFYFLRKLSKQLNERIIGYSVVSCFSQNKDELVIELNNSKDSFFIKANLSPAFCCLSFPKEYHRARKNSIDLFNEVVLKKVIQVTQFENERAFALELENQFSLIFKMHGSFANVLLVKNDRVESIFRNHLQTDFEIKVTDLHRSIDFSKESFTTNVGQLSKTYFTFGKLFFEYLRSKEFDQVDIEEKWSLFNEALNYLDHPNYYLLEKHGKLMFSLFPIGKILNEFNDPLVAINSFADQSLRDQFFYQEKNDFISQIHVRLKNTENYILKNQQKLSELELDHHYQLWGDLLMANLHTLKQGQEKITLNSFYDNQPVEIKLKKELSPQKNAEVFYRKSKNRQIEIDKLKESVAQKEKDSTMFKSMLSSAEEADDFKSLRQLVDRSGLSKKSSEQIKPLPYREFEFKGYKIWVGKNAQANDELTLKYSYKEDLWLHAKDVAGSHVLIKHQAGKVLPKDVIEYAASLAAFYSKRKNESLCPVAFTPKKFVRKRKGDPAGAVVVEKEVVILVEPLDGSR